MALLLDVGLALGRFLGGEKLEWRTPLCRGMQRLAARQACKRKFRAPWLQPARKAEIESHPQRQMQCGKAKPAIVAASAALPKCVKSA